VEDAAAARIARYELQEVAAQLLGEEVKREQARARVQAMRERRRVVGS